MTNNKRKWTDADIEKIRVMVNDGLTSQEIGENMGVTRNTIIGLRTRYVEPGRLPRKLKMIEPPKVEKERVLNYGIKPKKPPVPYVSKEPKFAGRPISFLDREHGQCCWPIGDARDLMCCGAPVMAKKSYCALHISVSNG